MKPAVGIAVVGLLGVGLAVTMGGESRPGSGAITKDTEIDLDQARAGDCLAVLPEQDAETAIAVPCGRPHKGEVFSVSNLPGFTYPGDDALRAAVNAVCDKELIGYVGKVDERFDWTAIYPSTITWGIGDRSVICLLERVDGAELTSPAREPDRTGT